MKERKKGRKEERNNVMIYMKHCVFSNFSALTSYTVCSYKKKRVLQKYSA